MRSLKFNNGIANDRMNGNYLLTEEKVEEILIAEGYDLSGGEEDIIDSVTVIKFASELGLKNLGDYGDGCIFYADYDKIVNELLEYIQ